MRGFRYKNVQSLSPIKHENLRSGERSLLWVAFVVVGLFIASGGMFLLRKQPTPIVEESLLPPQQIPDDNAFSGETQRQVLLDDDGLGYSTYRDKDYEFEVKFPKDWRIRVAKDSGSFSDGTTLAGFHFAPDSMCCDFLIAIEVTRGSLKDEVERLREVRKGWEAEQEKLPISNLDVVRVFDPKGVATYYTYLLERRGLLFTFTGMKMEMGEPMKDVFEGIVRSFRFIE